MSALERLGLVELTPAEEERRAREQHRHMQRMRREAERSRQRRESVAQRERRRQLRAALDEANRRASEACRAYGRMLTQVSGRESLPPELVRQWDRAYAVAISSCAHATAVRRELEEL